MTERELAQMFVSEVSGLIKNEVSLQIKEVLKKIPVTKGDLLADRIAFFMLGLLAGMFMIIVIEMIRVL
jgi:hypothetical protein